MSQHDYKLVAFGRGQPAPAADLASLHAQLLSHSPVALLGDDFMKRFYYSALPQWGLTFGAVAYVDGAPAGFIVATGDSSGFMRAGLRRGWLRLGWTMFVSLLRHPGRVAAVGEALAIMRGVEQATSPEPVGELLSFGLLPRYRERKFVATSRLRISQDLLREAMHGLAASGVTLSRAIVDADNLEARMFYLGNGWTPGLGRVPGWRKHTVEFLWRPRGEDATASPEEARG